MSQKTPLNLETLHQVAGRQTLTPEKQKSTAEVRLRNYQFSVTAGLFLPSVP